MAAKPKPLPIASELTPIGEQFIIPGCERDTRSGPAQLNLWGSAPPQSRTTDEQPLFRRPGHKI
jgi:hypothetical protein